jgi:twitching motility protein PilT
MSNIEQVLGEAVAQGASDVHLKVNQPPIIRVHGNLVTMPFDPLDTDTLTALAEQILPPHLEATFEINHEADFSVELEDIGRFRVNLFMAQNVPTFAMRHVKTRVPSFDELRLPPQIADLATLERGIVLVCGTTGSGKSTTLAAIINAINRTQRKRIITIEDPIEYLFHDEQSVVTQREVGIDTLSYQEALIHLMRQDPDVVLIGEMRDQASIRTALLAAQTGHLVLSTLHAGSAAMATPRMLDMFPADEQPHLRMAIAGTQHAVVCQRMLRDVEGRFVPAVEILLNTSTVRKLLERNRMDALHAAIETGTADGMQTFNHSIYELIRQGIVSEQEGMRHASNPESLRMNLKGIFLDEGKRILSEIL